MYIRAEKISTRFCYKIPHLILEHVHTKKLKYCSSEKLDENNNKFGKGWSPVSELVTGTNVSTITTLKLISKITPSTKIIYLKSVLISHQEVLLLASFHDTVNITTCNITPSFKKIALETILLPQEIEFIFRYLV